MFHECANPYWSPLLLPLRLRTQASPSSALHLACRMGNFEALQVCLHSVGQQRVPTHWFRALHHAWPNDHPLPPQDPLALVPSQ